MTTHDLSKYHILGKSRIMLDLAAWVRAAAPEWDTILITGERGTGKELLAKAIHRMGPTRGATPVTVDCAALHPATVESILFGHERGSFTGAVRRKIGFLESAHEGSVFLDEIGTLPLDIQGRFLRFLEEGTVTRIGAGKPVSIKTRVIAATNRPLLVEVERGAFLPDLFDRLNVLHIDTPPLRERDGDIVLLVEHFTDKRSLKRFTDDALEFLHEYPFPGNVRELRNLCRRLTVFQPKGSINQSVVERLLHPADQNREFTVVRDRVAREVVVT